MSRAWGRFARMSETPEATRKRAPVQPRSIGFFLIALAGITLLPAILFSAVLLQRNNEAQQQVVETLVVGSSRSIMQAVDREVNGKIITLKVLASTPALLEGDFRAFHARTRQALQGTGSNIVMLDKNFDTVFTTRTDYGVTSVRTGDVESAQKAIDTHDVVVSNALMGAVSKQWVYNVILPVDVGGGETSLLIINQLAQDLSGALLSNKLPDGWNVALVDAKGIIVAGSPGAGQSGQPFTLLDTDTMYSAFGWTPLDRPDGSYRAVIQHSSLTGWTLVSWAPEAVIAKPLSDSVWALVVGGVMLALLVIVLVYWVSLQINRSVRGLAADARRMGTGEAVTAHLYPVAEISDVSAALAESSRQRRAVEAEVQFLMRELAHRAKNQMTVITAMAKQTARGAESVPAFVESFQTRILGLARSTDLLMANGANGVDMGELIRIQIESFAPESGDRVRFDGPAVRLNAQAAQILGMAAHELATNAAKYGAFADDAGRLAVTWRSDGASVDLVWRERATPRPPSPRKGFGTTVLETMMSASLGARVTRTLHEDGIEWHFVLPLSALDPDRGDKPAP